ncbi:DUF5906 domain-containing protein [Thiolapillus sp.]|uniref:DUF5906 domain-containing protein n=1 Tax=Thiolapillus sp. TaxID=2017437 RepID=UPI003AF89A07
MKKYNKQLLVGQVREHHEERHYVRITPGEKSPLGKWGDKKPTLQALIGHIEGGGNIAMICDDILVIDVDDHDGSGTGKKSFKKLSGDIGTPLLINTQTPNDGHHCYLRLPNGAEEDIRVRLPEYPGIDFLSGKRYVLLPGCEIGGRAYVDVGRSVPDAPPALVDLIRSNRWQNPDAEDALGSLRTETEAEVRALLDGLDPNCHYDEWIRVGMAIHHWRPGKEGISLWAQWSERADKPATRAQMRRHWLSFNGSENPVTLSSMHAQVMQASRPEPVSESEAENGSDWVSEWVWVGSHKKYFSLGGNAALEPTGFDIEMGRFCPENEKGNRPTACAYFKNSCRGTVAEMLVYDPRTPDRLIVEGDVTRLNSFRPASVPVPAKMISGAGAEYIDGVMTPHLTFLAGGADEGRILECWIAHQVQEPGELLRWALLIHGEQGTGKSWLRMLLQTILGHKNVGVVTAEQINSPFKPWASGSVVCIFEELRLSGHNRHATANAIKPLITDVTVRVERKYVDSYEMDNVTNYAALTNYPDAIPLDETDRRWCVMRTGSLDDITDGRDAYFRRLWEGLELFGADIRAYFELYLIANSFRRLLTAPMTPAKRLMIATEQDEHDHTQLQDFIDAGGDQWSTDVIHVQSLFDAYAQVYDGVEKKIQRHALKTLGYMAYPKTIRVNGVVLRIWSKPGMSREGIMSAIKSQWGTKSTDKPLFCNTL